MLPDFPVAQWRPWSSLVGCGLAGGNRLKSGVLHMLKYWGNCRPRLKDLVGFYMLNQNIPSLRSLLVSRQLHTFMSKGKTIT